jgi:hypothetical protein
VDPVRSVALGQPGRMDIREDNRPGVFEPSAAIKLRLRVSVRSSGTQPARRRLLRRVSIGSSSVRGTATVLCVPSFSTSAGRFAATSTAASPAASAAVFHKGIRGGHLVTLAAVLHRSPSYIRRPVMVKNRSARRRGRTFFFLYLYNRSRLFGFPAEMRLNAISVIGPCPLSGVLTP